MFHRNSMAATLAAVCICFTPGGAGAQPIVVSGGSSLSEPLYQDEISAFPAPAFKPYLGRNSIAGKAAFLDNDATQLHGTGSVHWVASESILAQTQINDYLSVGLGRLGFPTGHGPLIQIPAAFTPVTISYRGPTGPVELTKAQLCGVMSGKIRQWSELGVSVSPALNEFMIVFRRDSSGTTELLTRHLRAVCGVDAAVTFNGKSTFSDEFPGGENGMPAHFVPAVGMAGIAAAAEPYPSVMTYMGPDPAFAANWKQARLFNVNDAFGGGQSIAYPPDAASVGKALGSAPSLPPSTGVVRRDPLDAAWLDANNQANPSNWVRYHSNPRSGYPIVGYTSFLVSQCYANTAVTMAIKDFLTKHYSAINDGPVRHMQIPLGPVNRARVLSSFVTGNSANLNIGNAAICSNYSGRG